jgi:hypothetical protein
VFRTLLRNQLARPEQHSGWATASALAIAFVLAADVAAAETKSPVSKSPVSIQIANPQAGRLQLVAATVRAPGIPVVLVKPDIPNEPWWVQGQATPSGPQGFSAKAIFGSATTLPGTKFRVIAILLDRSQEAYATGQTIKDLPNVPMSDQLLITLVKAGTPPVGIIRAGSEEPEEQPRLAEITSPGNGSDVARVTEVKGRIQKAYLPVVLVRPLAAESVWYVQKAPELSDEGEFSLKVVFGNSQTKQGQRFRVIVLALPSREAAAKLKVGTIIRKLPEGEDVSKEAVVTFREAPSKANTETQATSPKALTLR